MNDVKFYYVYRLLLIADIFHNDLHALAIWADLWLLRIAVNKTFMVYFGNHNKRRTYFYKWCKYCGSEVIRDLRIQVASVKKRFNVIFVIHLNFVHLVLKSIFLCIIINSSG